MGPRTRSCARSSRGQDGRQSHGVLHTSSKRSHQTCGGQSAQNDRQRCAECLPVGRTSRKVHVPFQLTMQLGTMTRTSQRLYHASSQVSTLSLVGLSSQARSDSAPPPPPAPAEPGALWLLRRRFLRRVGVTGLLLLPAPPLRAFSCAPSYFADGPTACGPPPLAPAALAPAPVAL